jgi:hypothetical protein
MNASKKFYDLAAMALNTYFGCQSITMTNQWDWFASLSKLRSVIPLVERSVLKATLTVTKETTVGGGRYLAGVSPSKWPGCPG